MPADDAFDVAGEVVTWSGSAVVSLPAGSFIFELQYAVASNNNFSPVMRVRRQTLSLVRTATPTPP
jgi:hypothetical protein